MPIIRLQDNTPEVYTNQSRDFQLMCRLYDCIVNGVKFDIDSMLYIINTENCISKVLQLLQTKLGFFTNKDITDEDLRYILQAFPVMIKNKGSLLAIKQAVRVYLKTQHIDTEVLISIKNKNADKSYVVQIGIKSSFRDTTVLDEMLRYILPTGYEFTYVFYTDINEVTNLVDLNKTVTLYASDTINSSVRHEDFVNDTKNRLLGAVDTTEVISSDSNGNADTVVIVTQEELPAQLGTPSIEVVEEMLGISNVDDAESYDLYIDGGIAVTNIPNNDE